MADSSTKKKLLRVGLLIATTLSIFGWLKLTGRLDDLDAEKVRAFVQGAGPWGALLYVVVFVAGELIHIPGMIFVAAGVLAFGQTTGFVISLVAAIASVTVSFVLVRAVGGKALTEIERPFVKKMLARLDQRPITTVIILRSIFWLAPPLNTALALSGITFWAYFVGSSLGLVAPILAATFFFDLFI